MYTEIYDSMVQTEYIQFDGVLCISDIKFLGIFSNVEKVIEY